VAKEIRLPKMGQTMEEGTIVRWLVEVGSEIKRGDVLCEVETDKATMEMDSPVDGFIKAILVKTDSVVAVNAPVAVVGAKDEVVGADFIASLGGAQAEAAPAAVSASAAAAPAPAPAAAPTAAVSVPAGVKAIVLEKMGQTMEEGTIVKSLVKVGDKVSRGDVIFEIETDKATMEMEATFDGFVKFVAVKEGDTLPVGNLLMVVAGEKDQVPQSYIDSLTGVAPATQAQASPAAAAAVPAAAPAEKTSVKAGGRVFASPKARMFAKKLGVDLATVHGTGPGGRIVAADVEKGGAAAGPASEAKLGSRIPMTRLQKLTGERMLQSKREIPCFYLQVRADVTELVAYREELKKNGQSVSYNDFIMKALAVALVKYPIMTGQLAGDAVKTAGSIGIGLAIAIPDGLVAPIVKNCEKKALAAIAADSKAIIERARAGKLSVDDFAGGCISVSNLGAFGIESFIPIVVPGQCSILGVGQISDTLVPVRGDILTRKLMAMYLSVDHRIANGAYAAQFLDYFRKALEDTDTFR
jgi:pyruvate dehydrogenase E2 component (dihydrolipoamide acetyltransferase)